MLLSEQKERAGDGLNHKMKKRRKKRIALTITLDVLIAALLIGGWFLDRIVRDSLSQPEPLVVSELRAEASPAPTPIPAQTDEPEETPPPEEEPEPDKRSEWQIRFAEHFTPEVVQSEDSYTSPNLSVVLTHHEMESPKGPVVYHIADIYIGNIDCFRSGLAATPPRFHMSASLVKMMEEQNGVVGINGDFCSYSYGGVAVRNGTVWQNIRSRIDLCVLYRDGTMETMPYDSFDLDDAVARDVWQVWSFGPQLLDGEGQPLTIANASLPNIHISGRNPRTAVGYYEPGHYCFLVADGRQPGYSVGMTLEEMGQVFSELGCKAAFNLDGGGSSMMAFQGQLVSQIYSNAPRSLSDCLLIADYAPEEEAVGGEEIG